MLYHGDPRGAGAMFMILASFYCRCRICPRRTGYSGRVTSFLMRKQLLCSCVLTCFVMRMLEGLWQFLFLEVFILGGSCSWRTGSLGLEGIFLLAHFCYLAALLFSKLQKLLVRAGASMHGKERWTAVVPVICILLW